MGAQLIFGKPFMSCQLICNYSQSEHHQKLMCTETNQRRSYLHIIHFSSDAKRNPAFKNCTWL